MSLHLHFPTLLSDASATTTRSWVQLAKVGAWTSQRDGIITITSDDLRTMLRNFVASGADLPIDYDHLSMKENAEPGAARAAGWLCAGTVELRHHDTELWGQVGWTPAATAAIRAREWRFISPAFERAHSRAGKNVGIALLGGALTNSPLIQGMDAVMLTNPSLGEMARQATTPQKDRTMKQPDTAHPGEQLTLLAKTRAATDSISFATALGLVVKENPELAEAWASKKLGGSSAVELPPADSRRHRAAPSDAATLELDRLARTRAKESGVGFLQALHEVASEREDLVNDRRKALKGR